MATKKNSIQIEKTVEGQMTFGNFADFACFENVVMAPHVGKFKVQIMRDGNVYMSELPKHKRNASICREDHSSLSLGQNKKYYFVLTLDERDERALPEILVGEAKNIARKFAKMLEETA